MPQGSSRLSQAAEPWHDYAALAATHLDARTRHDENRKEAWWAYRDLNLAVGRFRPSQLVLVSSEVGIGKTTFALDLCRSETFRRGSTCLLISPSISRTELSLRLLAAEAGGGRVGNLAPDHQEALRRAGRLTAHANLYIVAGAPMTIEEVAAVAHETWLNHDLDLIVVDDADLLHSAHRPSPRKTVGQLRQLADDLQIPVVATARVIRDAHPDYSRPPQSHQLWSADAENLINTLIMLHRPDCDGESTDRVDEIDLHISDANAVQHVVTLNFQGRHLRMTDKPWRAPPDE